MSSASGVTPLTFPRPRSITQTLPRARPVMKLEWNKLFAEATEKDTKECVQFDDTGYDERECEGNDSDYEVTEENEENDENYKNGGNEKNPDMPLNLCYKSKTVPNMSTHFENTDNSLDLSTKKQSTVNNSCHNYEASKQTSCTVPNLQSGNYQDILPTRKNPSDNCGDSRIFDTDEDNENIGINKVINTGIRPCNNFNYRTPMKVVNNIEPNVMSERKNKFIGSDQFQADNRSKAHTGIEESNNSINKSQKIQENNLKNTDDKSNQVSSSDQPDGNKPKRRSSSHSEKNHVRFAVPAVPEKPQVKSSGKTVVINGKTYQILAPLGKGGSSCVYLVLSSKNELLAVKCVKLSGVTESIKNDYLNEIQHLMKMQHSKHVIKLYDHQYIASHKLLYAVMEKGDTDLSRFLKDKAASEEGITPELILYYWNEMLLAVKSIHDNNIIHRDLKPANFLLVSGRLKLIDFGIASSIQNEQTSILMDTQSGTFNYMSPEALLDLGSGNEVVLKIGRKSDVWSLGCILYYFLYKKTPYQDVVKPLQKMRAITDPGYVVKFPKLPGVPDILIESCKRCLVHDRQKRASIEELLELKNRPLLTLSQVLNKLKRSLSETEYSKAEKALSEEIEEEI